MYMHISELGDCLGTESCVDLKPVDGADDVVFDLNGGGGGGGGAEMRRKGKGKGKEAAPPVGREYPPQISSLARVDSLQAPWVMRKYYTDDGRLVITEEKLRRHEYFRAHRSDGRLVMSFVPADDDDDDEDENENENEDSDDEEEEEIGDGEDQAAAADGGDGNIAAVKAEGEGIDGAAAAEGLSEKCKYGGIGRNDPCGGGGAGLGVALALAVGGGLRI
ncbi:heavy metal-associated isoprenylated plant protein 32 [Andrographis paniculata]|uniref:heavy metal-associated isoprenylated plant protein 32 n=1 Tax=Andrographis paniculata TaxID=175694 RepID=UPI0021E7C923|nr:heavy metal-associated isoprenylated plant protein 32 [Andrographis paniculata]